MKSTTALVWGCLVILAISRAGQNQVAAAENVEAEHVGVEKTSDRWAPFKDLASKLTGSIVNPDNSSPGGLFSAGRKHDESGKEVGAFIYDAVLTMFNFVVELAVELVRVYSPTLGETLHNAIVKTNLFSLVSKLAMK